MLEGRLLSLKGACEIEKSVQITCMQAFELHWIVTANKKKKFINDFFFANVVVGLVNEIWPGEVQRNGTRVDIQSIHDKSSLTWPRGYSSIWFLKYEIST